MTEDRTPKYLIIVRAILYFIRGKKKEVVSWKEHLIGCKIVSVEIDDTGIKSIIVKKKNSHIRLFPDSKYGINGIYTRYKNGKEVLATEDT